MGLSMSTEKPLIAVVGSTGAQGGAVVDALLAGGRFRVRALTRNPSGDKGKALAERSGVEVVRCDIDDADSIKKAFEGCYGAFCLTSFWEHFDAEKELTQAKAMADAAKANDLKHVVWTTLPDTRTVMAGKMPLIKGLSVPHFDKKGEADLYFKHTGVPTTYFGTSFYYENFIHFGMGPKKGEDGKAAICFPLSDAKMPMIAVADIGKYAAGVFGAGSKFINQHVDVQSEALSGDEMAAAFSDVLGYPVSYAAVPRDVYAGFGFPGADELANMFHFKDVCRDYFCSARTRPEVVKLAKPTSFRAWLAANKDKIPAA